MALHPQAQGVIAKRDLAGPTPTADAPLAERRLAFNSTWREPGPEIHQVQDFRAPGPHGDVPIRVYTPQEEGPLPAVVLYHGGGFVFGNVDTYDGYARRLAIGAQCVVANVEYRLAPEHKYPVAHDDAFAALQWVSNQADQLGIDPSQIAVGGDSVGANLSVSVALRSRDQGSPGVKAMILMCPAFQPDFEPRTHDKELTPPTGGAWWWWQYLDSKTDATNPDVVPLLAENLSGLPPALIITAEYDELRDEAEAFAKLLTASEVPTTCTRYDGMWHVFHMYPAHIDAAKSAFDQQLALLHRVFA